MPCAASRFLRNKRPIQPCPVCGSEGRGRIGLLLREGLYQVNCVNPKCDFCGEAMQYENDAIDNWDREIANYKITGRREFIFKP